MKILYVEDDPRDADLTMRTLRKIAPHLQLEPVLTIEQAFERLSRLNSEPLDLLLTDMHLRGQDGFSLLRHIRENNLPLAVVVVTGSGDEAKAVEALKARADDYVVKNKDYLDSLPITLESALNHYRADAARRAHPLKVLYAENELQDIEPTRRHFAVHANHLRLEVVATGSEALSALRSSDGGYDVLLMNLHLPDVNALEVIKELRHTLQLDLPVVLVCREGDDELASQGLKLGASSYVVKSPGYLYQLPWQVEEAYSGADLRRREAALNASEARNSAILSAIPDLMFLLSRDGKFLDYHATDPGSMLVPPEQFLGEKMEEVLPPELAAEFHRAFEQASDKPALIEYKLAMPDGEHAYEASVVTCEGDKILTIVRDITERKLAEQALRESEARLRRAQEAARVGTWEWDVRTGESVWSEMIWELLGLEPGDGEPTVEKFVEFIHPEDRDRVWRKVNKAIDRGEEYYYDEFRVVRRDGSVLWVSSKGRPFSSNSGRPERMIGVNIDITERKLAEEALKSALDEVRLLKDRLHEENIYLQEEIRVATDFGEIIGDSAALRKVLRQAEQVASTDTTVLILGETGTGKELLAHAIHNHSRRQKRPLVKVNCAALPAPLIENELFGHEKGAFTGADSRRMGRFALADGGSIFLDEVGELPLDLQTKLLRVLEEGEFELVGGSRTVSVDVRIIAATNRDLSKAVANGTFRSDLYYRLSIFPITMPPLRERREDIRMLVAHLVKQLSGKIGKKIESIPQSVISVLQNYDWPGNVRELKNVIERAVIISQGSKLQLIETFDPLTSKTESADLSLDPAVENETLEQSEYRLILSTLKKVHWRVEGPGGAADLLGVHSSTLRSRMKKLGISRPKVQASGSSQ